MHAVLSLESVEARRRQNVAPDRVLFRVRQLYGLCPAGASLPIGTGRHIDSGPIALTMDPDADSTSNLGVVDFALGKLKVRYGAQAVFPALHDLVVAGNHDPALLNPTRLVATDDCTLTPDYTGWQALGCLDFLPGSVWSGAAGG